MSFQRIVQMYQVINLAHVICRRKIDLNNESGVLSHWRYQRLYEDDIYEHRDENNLHFSSVKNVSPFYGMERFPLTVFTQLRSIRTLSFYEEPFFLLGRVVLDN